MRNNTRISRISSKYPAISLGEPPAIHQMGKANAERQGVEYSRQQGVRRPARNGHPTAARLVEPSETTPRVIIRSHRTVCEPANGIKPEQRALLEGLRASL